jgi:hypothetical protein
LGTIGTGTRVTADGDVAFYGFVTEARARSFLFNRQTFPKPNRIFDRCGGVVVVTIDLGHRPKKLSSQLGAAAAAAAAVRCAIRSTIG